MSQYKYLMSSNLVSECGGLDLRMPTDGSFGSSVEADSIDSRTRFETLFGGSSISIKKSVLYEKVDSSWREASVDGWDGPHSKSSTFLTREMALSFLKLLPFGMRVEPDIFTASSGGIVFEWEVDDAEFTVVVEGREVIYSYISDNSRSKGIFNLKNEIDDILLILKKIKVV